MARLFVAPERLREALGGGLLLSGEDHHYLVHVLRRRPGDLITLLDGQGLVARAVIGEVGGQATRLLIEGVEETPKDAGPRITLMQGMVKGDKFDLIVQKATELGAANVVPVLCARSVARPGVERAAERQRRWVRIARGAAQQCRRPDVPEIAPLVDLQQALVQVPEGLRLLPFEGALRQPLRDVLPAPLPARITVLVGPEGGFEPG